MSQIFMDLNKQTQSAGDNSTQTIANTVNNNYGIQVADVIPIVHGLVKAELEIYQQEAEFNAQIRFNEFTKSLESTIERKVADKVDRFAEPAMQFATRQATIGYIKSGDLEQKDSLIDLLVERINTYERTSMQLLIDEAIQILPRLSTKCIAILTLLTYSSLKMTGFISGLTTWIKNMTPILAKVSEVQSIDVEYLVQTGCLTSILGFHREANWLQSNIQSYPLLFSHYDNREAAEQFKTKYGIQSKHGALEFNGNYTAETLVSLLSIVEFKEDGTIIPTILDKEFFAELSNDLSPFESSDLMSLIEHRTSMTIEEVTNFYKQSDPKWENAITLLVNKLSGYNLTLVGKYIGLRQLSKLSGKEIPIEKLLI